MQRKRILLLISISILFIGALFFWRFWLSEQTERKSKLTLYGNVDVRQAILSFRVGGRLTAMHHEEGDSISSNELLASIDPQIYKEKQIQADEHLNSLKAQLTSLNNQRVRRNELVVSRTVSEEEFDSIELEIKSLEAKCREAAAAAAEAAISVADTDLFAFQKGIILTRVEEPGAVVSAGHPIYVMTIPKPLWIRTFVAEPDLGRLRPGMPAEVITDTPTNPIYKGQVGFISPVAEFTPKSVETTSLRTNLVYQVRIVVTDPDQGLRQGMPVTVKIQL